MADPALLASLLVVVVTVVAGAALVHSGRRRHLPSLAVVAAVALVVAATALPSRWTTGDGAALALAPGHGGLGKAGLQLLAGSPGAAAELLVLNGLLYLPLGAALSWRWPGRPVSLLLAAVVSLGVETAQWLVLDRVAATDDLLVNVGGAVVGWLLAWWWARARGGGATT